MDSEMTEGGESSLNGYCGVGKSSLAKTLGKKINALEKGIHKEGKFVLTTSSDESHSGIATAFGEMCKVQAYYVL
eukprot:scaffold5887_cov122-Cylindrotheca_fusiformis.AAC.22